MAERNLDFDKITDRRNTNCLKYDFLREPWRWDSKNFVKLLLHKIFAQKSIGMPGEQEYHICLYDFSFSSTLIKTCGRTLISALHNLRKHHKICYYTVS